MLEEVGESYHSASSFDSPKMKQNKGSSRGKLKRQQNVSQDSTEVQMQYQMLKQESKDSGIVTEMITRPKESSKDIKRSESMHSEKFPRDTQSSRDLIEYSQQSSRSNRSVSTKSVKSSGGNVKLKRGKSVRERGQKDYEGDEDQSKIELLMPKQNGSLDEDQENKKNPSIIRGMWKKAFKSLKSGGGEKLSKKGSVHKKKPDSIEQDEPQCQSSGPVDPVYSLLKCAADLPKVGKPPCSLHASCTLHSGPGSIAVSSADSSDNTSKTSSHSSSASHSPKARRKKLNARMKSFSLDTPEPPKHLLGIDESTKKKSSSFTNTCFGGGTSPEDKMMFSASSLRKKFASLKASSLEMEERKNRSYSPSPKESPKSQKKQMNLYVALYNFKAKEKDDMDLIAGMRINVTNSSKKDWWKGRSLNGKCGYFPATYVIPLQDGQRVFQVLQPLNLTDGYFGVKFHKDQIVLQIGEEVDGFIMVRAANNRQAMCPLIYLQEL